MKHKMHIILERFYNRNKSDIVFRICLIHIDLLFMIITH